MSTSIDMRPRASLRDVLHRRANVVGARFDPMGVPGLVSPIEPRLRMGILYDDPVTAEREALRKTGPRAVAGVLAKLFIARFLGGNTAVSAEAKPFIVAARVDNVDVPIALDLVFQKPTASSRFVAFVHPHALNLATFDPELASIIEGADAILPDGIGVRIAARLLGRPLRANVNGTDLLPLVAAEAVRRGVPLALVGAKPGVAARCAQNLAGSHPGLSIPIVSDGYLDEAGTRALLSKLREAGRIIVLVGMGTPIQEQWIAKVRSELPEATLVSVGGLFDFFSGDVQRAPMVVRELGLEWAFRMAREPRRLAKRYLLGNPLFLTLAVKQWLGERRRAVTLPLGFTSGIGATANARREPGRSKRP
ncbi:MAG: WecB/TagA/CpsF family glycosyltransferase [Polyangiaceae bacterium]|nr:WecB/TagA/CpsF family glycosyltransferase [Polyangiaceae bacterium]